MEQDLLHTPGWGLESEDTEYQSLTTVLKSMTLVAVEILILTSSLLSGGWLLMHCLSARRVSLHTSPVYTYSVGVHDS